MPEAALRRKIFRENAVRCFAGYRDVGSQGRMLFSAVVHAGFICLLAVLASAQELPNAVAALESGRLDEAAGALTAILRDKPDDADANYYLALARFRQGRQRESSSLSRTRDSPDAR